MKFVCVRYWFCVDCNEFVDLMYDADRRRRPEFVQIPPPHIHDGKSRVKIEEMP